MYRSRKTVAPRNNPWTSCVYFCFLAVNLQIKHFKNNNPSQPGSYIAHLVDNKASSLFKLLVIASKYNMFKTLTTVKNDLQSYQETTNVCYVH